MKIQLFRVINLCVRVAEYLYKVNPQQVCSESGHPNMITRYHANLLHLPGQPRAVAPHIIFTLQAPRLQFPSFLQHLETMLWLCLPQQALGTLLNGVFQEY